MKIEEIIVKFEKGDTIRANALGIQIEHNGRVYLSNVSMDDLPKDGRVTFRDYCSPENAPASFVVKYKPSAKFDFCD